MTETPNKSSDERHEWVTTLSIISLVLWVSFAFTEVFGFPGLSLRFLGITAFCVFYIWYFYFTDKGSLYIEKNTLYALLSLFGLILIGSFSSFFAINQSESIQPLASLTIRVLLLILLGHAIQNGLNLVKLSLALTFVGFILSFHGILEVLIHYWEYGKVIMPKGLLSNNNFYSSALILLLPFICITIWLQKSVLRVFAIFSLSFVIAGVILAQTRASYLAGIVFFGISYLIYQWHNSNKVNRRRLIYLAMVSTVLISAMVAYQNRKSFDVLVSDKITVNGSVKVKSAAERLILWRNTLQIIEDNPIIGVGPGNWKIHFAGVEKPPNRVAQGKNVVVRAHNVYLEIIAEMGFIGMFSYILFVFFCLKQWRKNLVIERADYLPNTIFLAAFLAFLVDQFFSFPDMMPTHLVYSSIPLGYLLFTSKNRFDRETVVINFSRASLIIAVLLVVLTIVYGASFIFETKINSAKYAVIDRNYDSAISDLNIASEFYPGLSSNGDSPAYLRALIHNNRDSPDDALRDLIKARELSPFSSRVAHAFGDAYYSKGKYEIALRFFKDAYKVQSKNIVIGEKIGLCYFLLRDYQACVKILRKLSIEKGSLASEVYEKALNHIKQNNSSEN